jgi:hypothetical protein
MASLTTSSLGQQWPGQLESWEDAVTYSLDNALWVALRDVMPIFSLEWHDQDQVLDSVDLRKAFSNNVGLTTQETSAAG